MRRNLSSFREQPIVINQQSIGLGTLLMVLFVGLKLTGFIAWSWYWVLFPITIPLTIVGIVFVLGGLVWVGSQIIGK